MSLKKSIFFHLVLAASAFALRAEVDRDLLLGLLRIPSVTMDQAQNNRAVHYLKGWFDAHGVFTAVETNEAGRAALYAATVPGKCHDIVFVTHLDVVPPSREGQFDPVVKDGFAYGRGACDTKGNVAVIAKTLANLAGRGSVGAVFATDEETRTGASDTPTPTHLLNVGYVPRKFLVIGDTNGEFTDSLTIAEKGHVAITLRAHGRGGHSSMPWAADNPIPKLLAAYAKVQAALPKPADPNDHWRNDLTPTKLLGAPQPNIIPDTAEMTFSYRFIDMDGAEKMKSFLEATTGLEVILPKTWRRPVITDPENPYVRSLHAAMRRTWPDREIPLTRMSCATDATRYAHLSLPTVIFGATGYGAHAKDERVSLASLDAYEAMFTAFLAEIESIESK